MLAADAHEFTKCVGRAKNNPSRFFNPHSVDSLNAFTEEGRSFLITGILLNLAYSCYSSGMADVLFV